MLLAGAGAHSSSHASGSKPSGSGTSFSNSSQSSRSTCSSAVVAERISRHAGRCQQVVSGQVLERDGVAGRARARRNRRRDRPPGAGRGRLSGHARRPREMPREEPFGRPRRRCPRSATRRARTSSSSSACSASRSSVGARGRSRTRPCAARSRARRAPAPRPRATRSRVGNANARPAAHAEALDEAAADRERGEQRDLLRGDRRDEALERDRARAAAGTRRGSRRRARSRAARRPRRRTGRGRTGAPSSCSTTGRVVGVERLDVDPARRRGDPHLASADHAVERAVVPEVRQVRPEHAEPLGRELEVVRLGQAQQRRFSTLPARDGMAPTVYDGPRSARSLRFSIDVTPHPAPARRGARRPSGARAGGRIDAAGGGARGTGTSIDDAAPVWSPDGKTIAFASRAGGHWQIYTVHANGGGRRALTSGALDSIDVAWSPEREADRLLARRGRSGDHGRPRLRDECRPAAASARSRTVAAATTSSSTGRPTGSCSRSTGSRTGSGRSTSWRRAARSQHELTPSYGRRRLLGRLVARRQQDRVRPHGSERVRRHLGDERRRLGPEAAHVEPRADDFGSAWSPDGTQIAFQSNRTGRYQIYVWARAAARRRGSRTPRATPASRTGRPTASRSPFQEQVGGNYEIFVAERDRRRRSTSSRTSRSTTPTPPGRRTARRSPSSASGTAATTSM